MARESMWESRTQTIAELLGLPAVAAGTTDEQLKAINTLADFDATDRRPDSVKAATLYSHKDFVALFGHIDDVTRVTRVVVSAYFNLSTNAIEAGLAARYPLNKDEGNWRRQLASMEPEPVPLLNGGYRWSFVRDDMPDILARQIERANDRLLKRTNPTPGPVTPRRVPTLFAGPLVDGVQYLVDRHGRVLFKLGQGHITAARFIAHCADGATLQWLTPVEALQKPWADLVARAAWEEPVRDAIDMMVRYTKDGFDTALAHSEQLRLEATVATADETGRRPGPLRKPL